MCAGRRRLVLGSVLFRNRRFTVKRFINFVLFVAFLVGVSLLYDKAFAQVDNMTVALDRLAVRG